MNGGTAPSRIVGAAVGEGYEFWDPDGKRTLKAAAITLLAHGLTEEDAVELIGSIWSASAKELGHE